MQKLWQISPIAETLKAATRSSIQVELIHYFVSRGLAPETFPSKKMFVMCFCSFLTFWKKKSWETSLGCLRNISEMFRLFREKIITHMFRNHFKTLLILLLWQWKIVEWHSVILLGILRQPRWLSCVCFVMNTELVHQKS